MKNGQIPNTVVRDFLSMLEKREEFLLSWGIVDGGFSEEELEELTETFVANCDGVTNGEALRDQLEDQRLLFEIQLGTRRVYRTRMAETLRLLARLRQQFPNRDWRTAPTLVADYRFAVRPRRYPARNIPVATTLDRVGESVALRPVAWSALHRLLESPSRTLILSDFQVRATVQVLRDLSGNQSRGAIVCAGTGTGKTLAFYLPTLTHISGLITQNSFWTKGLAIYPRNELLKDQFSESYREARLLDQLLTERVGRKLVIGAYFGPTPRRADLAEIRDVKEWEPAGNGFVCPYIRCPRCEGALIWSRDDIQARQERLSCSTPNCGAVICSDEVILTRDRLASSPPDLLFTTTEMLNRQLSNSRDAHLFGVGVSPGTRPRVVLLDEVHTYHGVHGAHVAHVLRRWRHMVGGSVQFTGLSATLRDATEFFARLTGLHPAHVEEISPSGDLIEEGMEYLVALRGDPVSGTSLLSTTIQASMLLRRMMETNASTPSTGPSGRRVYVFTDDLDVTNRLYHNLLDAEARDGFGNPKPGGEPLAALRAHARPDPAPRLSAGQSWRVAESIGHRLTNPLVITRTSSQDTGVARNADVIVATASLEVGYNDPEVGAVIQHKAPRDVASFLQRKGRAGRRRSMRPWTIAVLSDYGRDRFAYQGYELLFDPILEARSLPTSNGYVLRIQAVYAFMEWIAQRRPPEHRRGSIWMDFAGPANGKYPDARARQLWEAGLVDAVLSGGEPLRDLTSYLGRALKISEDELHAVLWEPPRALMTSVLPTLLRRLRSGWERQQLTPHEGRGDHVSPRRPPSPLPDFLPENLFSDLNLPEVTVLSRRSKHSSDYDDSALPIVQGMRALAPGNITRRFAPHRSQVSHWIPPPALEAPEQACPVDSIVEEFEELGDVQVVRNGTLSSVRCVRPWLMRAEVVPFEVLPTSKSTLTWMSQIFPAGETLPIEVPSQSPWRDVITEMRFYTHSVHANAVTRRFSLESMAQVRFRNGSERQLRLRFTDAAQEAPVAIGFAKPVDAIAFRYQLPHDLHLDDLASNRFKLRGLRAAYFAFRVSNDERLMAHANSFQRDWLAQIYLSALTARALSGRVDLATAANEVSLADLTNVLTVIFQTLETAEQADGDDASDESGDTGQRVHDALRELCERQEVRVVLEELATVLWSPPDAHWQTWISERFASTLAGAMLQACQRICPQFDAGDLLADITSGPRPSEAPAEPPGVREIWISEDSVGGAGVIEEILKRYLDDPSRFFRLADAALEPSDFEVIDTELTRFLGLLQGDTELQTIVASARTASGNTDLANAVAALRDALGTRGLLASHPVMSAIQARVLRPGTNEASDSLLHLLVTRWREEEERLGIEIDARVFAFVASAAIDFGDALNHVASAYRADPRWRFNVLYSLLWPRGHAIRARALSTYNPFAQLPEADRRLLADCVCDDIAEVALDEPEWLQRVAEELRSTGTVRLVAQAAQRLPLHDALLRLAAEPLEVGFLHLHPSVDGIRHRGDVIEVTLRLREALQ